MKGMTIVLASGIMLGAVALAGYMGSKLPNTHWSILFSAINGWALGWHGFRTGLWFLKKGGWDV